MSVLAYRLRAEARAQWPSWLGVAVLIGIFGGLTMGLVAGARRTNSAYARFLETTEPSDVLIAESTDFGITRIDLDAAAALPGVRASAVTAVFFSVMRLGDGRLLLPGADAIVMVDSASVGDGLDAPRVVEGRLADPNDPREAVVGWNLARRFGIEVGDQLEISLVPLESVPGAQAAYFETLGDRLASPEPDTFDWDPLLTGPRVEVEIVGITSAPLEFPPQGGIIPIVRVTPAFEEFVGTGNWSTRYLHAGLRPGVSVATYQRNVEAEASDGNAVVVYSVGRGQAASVEQGFAVQALGAAALAVLILVAGLIIVAQSSARLVAANGTDARTLKAIGWGSRGLTRLAVARLAVIALGGAALAVGIAVAISPLWPDGNARFAEVDRGMAVDAATLIVGVIAIVCVVPLLAIWPSRRRSRTVRVGGLRAPAVGPPTARLGAGFAFGSRSRGGAVPVRSSIIAIAMALSLGALVLVIEGQSERLNASPSSYGWNWDMQLGSPGLPSYARVVSDQLSALDEVTGLAAGTITNLDVDGRRVDVLAVDDVKGSVKPTVRSGVAPRGAGEIALGSLTLDAIGAEVGDTLEVTVGDRTRPFRVVGAVVTPTLGDQGRLGIGGFTTAAALDELVPGLASNVVLVDLRQGTPERVLDNIRLAFAPIATRDARNGDELSFTGAIPTGTLGFPLLIAVAVIANVLAMSVRRRRGDLAIARALGLTPAQARRVIFVEAAIIGLVAFLIGAPLGAAVGRTIWEALLARLGIDGPGGIDWSRIVVLAVVIVVMTWMISLVPAWRAARRPPAEALWER